MATEHEVRHAASNRQLGFGELAEAAAELEVPAAATLRFRPKEEWRYIGKGVPLADGPDIAQGKAIYGADVRLEGMRFAVIARPPVLGDEAIGYDEEAALAVPGVEKVVRLRAPDGAPGFAPLGGIAVIADQTWAAITGRGKLQVEWAEGRHSHRGYDSAEYAEERLAAVRAPGEVVRANGDVAGALKDAAQTVVGEYHVPHLAHASMEPPVATVRVGDGEAEAWAATQNPQAARSELARALGFPEEKVVVHVTLLGGGFGRKSKPDFVVEAGLLARELGAPVQVVWTREDDIRHDYFHTVGTMRLEGALDADGQATAIRARAAFPPISSTFNLRADTGSGGECGQGFTDMPFELEHVHVETCKAPGHLRIGWLRSVVNIPLAFALGSFVDELAHAAGRDPLEFWLETIGSDRHLDFRALGVRHGNYGSSLEEHPYDTGRLKQVLRTAAEQAGWGRELPAGHGLGLSVHRSFVSSVACVAEVAVAGDRIGIPRIDIVADCGMVLHRDRVVAQMEGAAVFGAGIALSNEITARDGAVVQSNFHDFRIPTMTSAPREVHVTLIDSDAPPGGVGEPGVPPVAPAIVNAVFAATGKRYRELPLSRHGFSG